MGREHYAKFVCLRAIDLLHVLFLVVDMMWLFLINL